MITKQMIMLPLGVLVATVTVCEIVVSADLDAPTILDIR